MTRPRVLLGILVTAAALGTDGFAAGTAFVGYVTDTECGPDHAPMIAKGGMGKSERDCTYACVAKGATFGFVDADRRRFFQLDDQEAPRPFAGQKVRITGTLSGDTILVTSVEPAD